MQGILWCLIFNVVKDGSWVMKDIVKVDIVCIVRFCVMIIFIVYLVKWVGNIVCIIGVVLCYFEGEIKWFCLFVGYQIFIVKQICISNIMFIKCYLWQLVIFFLQVKFKIE